MSLVLFAAGVGVAFAHANLVRSEPGANAVLTAAPAEIRLWFSEPVEARFCEVELFDRTGQRLDVVGPLRTDPADSRLLQSSLKSLPGGVYTAAWRALSAVDGHVTAGTFAFAVGEDQVPVEGLRPSIDDASAGGASGPTVAGVVTRWLGYLATALLAGGFAFFPLVLRPALAGAAAGRRNGRPRPRTHVASTSVAPLVSVPAPVTPLLVGAALAVVASLAGAVLQAAAGANVGSLAGLAPSLVALLGGTRYGLIFWMRLVLLISLGVLLLLGRRQLGRGDARWWWVGFGLSSLVMLTSSLGSHAAAGRDPALAIAADWLHLLALGVWVGGLVGLSLTLPRLRRGAGTEAPDALPRLVGRFSRVATVCLVVLGLTGAYRAIAEIGEPDNLIDTAYGMTLLVKLGLIVPLLGLAAVNLLLIQRRLAQSVGTSERNAASTPWYPWYRRVRGIVGGEVLVVTAVLAMTGVLTSLPPAREAFGAGLVVRGQQADLRIVLAVDPGLPAFNTFDLYLRDGLGRPVVNAQKVGLIFRMVDHDMGENAVVAEDLGGGHFRTRGFYVAMSGTWRVDVLVRRFGEDDVLLPLTLQARPSRSNTATPTVEAPALPTSVLLAVGLAALAVGLASVGKVLRAWRRAGARGAVLLAVGLALVVLGAGLGARVLITPLAPATAEPVNPYPPTDASLRRGQEVYRQQCALCHGLSGRGDGPQAVTLRPRPADLSQHVAAHPDGELYQWITNGVPGSPMPVFKDLLSDADRWHVLNYIKTFAPVDR